MSIKEATYYYVECDIAGCGARTGDMGEFSAWSDHGAALDDWISGDGYHDKKSGQTLCEDHRPKLCAQCDDVIATGVDADGDDACDEHRVTPFDPAPAASSPASQAVTGTVAEHTAAAPVARTVDIGMCRCGHPVGEHDTDGNGFCTGSVGWDATHADYLACDCKSYVAAGGAS